MHEMWSIESNKGRKMQKMWEQAIKIESQGEEEWSIKFKFINLEIIVSRNFISNSRHIVGLLPSRSNSGSFGMINFIFPFNS